MLCRVFSSSLVCSLYLSCFSGLLGLVDFSLSIPAQLSPLSSSVPAEVTLDGSPASPGPILAGVRTADGLSQPLSLPKARMLVAYARFSALVTNTLPWDGLGRKPGSGGGGGWLAGCWPAVLVVTIEADAGPALPGGDPAQCPHLLVPQWSSSLNCFGDIPKPLSTTEDSDLQKSPSQEVTVFRF